MYASFLCKKLNGGCKMGKLVNDNLKATTGVYGIYLDDKLIYVGWSQDIQKRYSNHAANLKQGKHKNKHLQAIYDTSEELTMKAIRYCSANEAIELEFELINANSGLCNILTKKGNVIKYSEDSKIKMSRSQSCSKNGNAKLDNTTAGEIILRLRDGESISALAEEYGVTYNCVYNIAKCKTWKTLLHRYMGDGTEEPLTDLVLRFEVDEETASIMKKITKMFGSENICRAVKQMQRS